MLSTLLADFKIIFERDPAARNWLEVLFFYPGLQAILFHRVAHQLYKLGIPFIPRLISFIARFITGIEIHPGAVIGRGFFIDHGMGVVIGETAIVGDNVLLYQGVTLGGTGKECGKRHPTLGNNVVVGVPGRIIYRSGARVDPLEHGSLPDSEAEVIRALVDRIESLEQQLEKLQQQQPAYQAALSEANCKLSKIKLPAETHVAASCQIRDKAIQQFLDGAGI